MLVNKANISRIFENLKTTFHKAFGAVEPQWKEIAMEVPSTGKSNNYAWLSRFPAMRRWVGEKVFKSLKAFTYTVENDDWSADVEVYRNDIEDDELGIYGPQAQMAGQSAAELPDTIIGELINGVFTEKCFDGQYMCDTDHPGFDKDGEETTYSNKGTVKLKAGTLAEAQASFGAARTVMRKAKDEEGKPLGIKPTILLVGPHLEDTALIIANSDRFEDGKPNPYKGTIKVVVNDRLEEDEHWFLLDTRKPVKPFIYQKRKAPVFVSQTDMNADDVYSRGVYKFGAEARAAGGYGFWQTIWGSDGTTG